MRTRGIAPSSRALKCATSGTTDPSRASRFNQVLCLVAWVVDAPRVPFNGAYDICPISLFRLKRSATTDTPTIAKTAHLDTYTIGVQPVFKGPAAQLSSPAHASLLKKRRDLFLGTESIRALLAHSSHRYMCAHCT